MLNVCIRRVLIGILLLALWAAAVPRCRGAPIPWRTATYSYIARGESVREVLKEFCSSQGIPVVISDKVRGTVSGRFVHYSPKRFFGVLVKAYGLMWYFDGAVLYIYSSDEVTSTLVRLRYESVDRFIDTLKELGIYDERFTIKAVPEQGVLFVAGPPKYIQLITQAASLFDKSYAEEEIRIFKLKYAWAADHTFTINDQQITVPGVATILRGILSGKAPEGVSPQVKQLAKTLKKLRGTGLAAVGKKKKKPKKNKAVVPSRIVADSRLNAVIIRDTKDKMPIYQKLISMLDVPAGLVQIEVTISDVSVNSLRELGFSWRINNYAGPDRNKIDLGINAPKDFKPNSESFSVGTGLNMATTISLYRGRYILARLKALEEKGKAKILSRPSVLTINNVQAVIEQTSTFYARVAGEHDVDLFNITAGIVLKVTPHIIEENGKKKIKLFVDIEDGSVQFSQTVDNLPVVPKSCIHTQAVVSEDQILVLGGYVIETKSKSTRGIPILQDIPILGALFSFKTTQTNRQERIFMIHARLLSPQEQKRMLSKNE